MKKEDLTKLPQWAQTRIRVLERDLQSAWEEARRGAAGETRVRGRDGLREYFLPDSDTYTFVVQDGEITGEIEVRLSRPSSASDLAGLVVRSSTHALTIKPESVNACTISVRRY